MHKQLKHSEIDRSKQLKDIFILCDTLESPANIGSLFRICDAFGVKHVYFLNNTPNFSSSRLSKTSRNTDKTVSYTIVTDNEALINELRDSKIKIIALEITDKSISLRNLAFKKDERIAILIGNEKNGISNKLLKHAEQVFHIEMYGENSSINVIQATGIALYSLTNP